MRHKWEKVGIHDFHGDRGDLLWGVGQEPQQPLEGGVVTLHRAHLDDPAGGLAPVGDPAAIGGGQRERFLAQHVHAGVDRGHRDVRVHRVGGGDHDAVEVEAGEAGDVVVQLGGAVALTDPGAGLHGRVCNRHEFEPVALLPQVEGVFGLGDQPNANEAHSEFFRWLRRHLSSRLERSNSCNIPTHVDPNSDRTLLVRSLRNHGRSSRTAPPATSWRG